MENFIARVCSFEAFKALTPSRVCPVCPPPPSFILPLVFHTGLVAGLFPSFCFSCGLAYASCSPVLRAVLPGCALLSFTLCFFRVSFMVVAPCPVRRSWGILALFVFADEERNFFFTLCAPLRLFLRCSCFCFLLLTFSAVSGIMLLKGGDFVMAIFNPGPAVASVSGSVGGTVFSRNKGGAYMRNRAVPVTSQSEKALKYKSALAAISQTWRSLTAAQRLAWASYAASAPYTNRLGMSKQLSALNHFIKLNTRLLICGDTGITDPPVGAAPSGVTVSGFVVDTNLAQDTEVAFADSPLDADYRLWIRAAKVNSASILNVENLLTELLITAKAATTPVDLQAALIAAFGTLQAGADYILEVRVIDTTTGYVSNRVFIRTTAITTP